MLLDVPAYFRRCPCLMPRLTLLPQDASSASGAFVCLAGWAGARTPEAECLRTSGAHTRIRTGDLVLTKDTLHHLSYVGSSSLPVGGGGFEPP